MSIIRRGSVALTPGYRLPLTGPITLLDLRRVLTELTGLIDQGGVGDLEIANVSVAKLVSGILSRADDTSDPVTMQLGGAKVIFQSANYTRDLQRFVATVNKGDSTLSSTDTTFTNADIGGSVTADFLIAGTTITGLVSGSQVTISTQGVGPFEINSVTGTVVAAARAAGEGWAITGDGKLYAYAGNFGGTIHINGFNVALDGTVTIGVGLSKMTALPDGTFTWGNSGRVIGIAPDGTFYAGGTTFGDAVVAIAPTGITVRSPIGSTNSIGISTLVNDIIAPKALPAGGAYDTALDVQLYDETPGTAIYYTITTDGSTPADPTIASTLFTGAAIHITNDTVKIKAIAIKAGFSGPISAWTFTQVNAGGGPTTVPNPVISPPGGSYSPTTGHVTITFSGSLNGSSIRYTTNGTDPSSTVGTLIAPASGAVPPSGTLSITGNPIVKAIAYKSGLTDSGIVREDYHITMGGTSGGGGGSGGRWPEV